MKLLPDVSVRHVESDCELNAQNVNVISSTSSDMCMELKVTRGTLRSVLNLLDLIICVTSFLALSFNCEPPSPSLSLSLSVCSNWEVVSTRAL